MRLVFLLESAGLWGGVKTVLRDAGGLAARGHDVLVLCKSPPPDWMAVECPFATVPDFAPHRIPEADAVVGTYWTTVPFAAACGRGVPVHYCQGYEGDNPECAPHRAAIEATYELPVAKITIAHHLEHRLRARFGGRVRRIAYAIDERTMFPGPEREPGRPLRVGIVGPYAVAWKDIRTGLRACALAHAAGLPVQAVRASNTPRHPEEHDAPFPIEWHERVPPAAMGALYRSLDVFLGTSRGEEEGFFLPSVEAMACGVPCVLTDIPCARGYDDAHDYARFVPPADPVAMARAIVEVAGDAALRRRLRAAGLRTAARHGAARHLAELEAALVEAVRGTPPGELHPAPRAEAVRAPAAAHAS